MSGEGTVRARRGRSPAPKAREAGGEGREAAGDPAKATRGSAQQQHHQRHAAEYEFGGPPGALATMVALPLVIVLLYVGASKDYKINPSTLLDLPKHYPTSLDGLVSLKAAVIVCGWFVFHVLMERVLFYEKAYGVKLANGQRLTYRISAHLQFWVTLLVMNFGYLYFDDEGKFVRVGPFRLAWIYEHYIELALAAVGFSSLLSVLLYTKSFKKGALLAKGGDTGNHIYDFFIGRELNPRLWGSFDLKQFCELRPGLIGWVVVNAGCAAKQLELTGRLSPEMVMINLFQGVYVFDALYHERAILTTMDITTDGFGFMLAFGDLAWVPFTYSLQARYLVENSPGLDPLILCFIFGLNFLGYYIFRGSNSEKDAFRRDPSSPEVSHLETITTQSGRKLLVSGWWGMARKINYTGDWLMGLAWCLTTGFGCLATYFYAIYFFVLLVHRAYRDNHACAEKYGPDWPAYRSRVPYVFVPGLV